VAEQHSEKDMGVTPEVMKSSLESLGYRVVDVVKALGLFSAGEAAHNTNALQDAYTAGEKLLRTLRLRKKIEILVRNKNYG
ncbi:MAG: flavodoxin family protein, partial [Flexistipes sinusarabici]